MFQPIRALEIMGFPRVSGSSSSMRSKNDRDLGLRVENVDKRFQDFAQDFRDSASLRCDNNEST